MANLQKVISSCESLKSFFNTGKTLSYDFRINQLNALRSLVSENKSKILEALKQDLNKSYAEAVIMEYGVLMTEIKDMINNLSHYMEPEKVRMPSTVFATNSGEIHKDPLGLTLIIGAWNYPISECLGPLVGAIAGGNVTFIKPSESSSASEQLLSELIPKYLDNRATICLPCSIETSKNIVKSIEFDHIFYTGGTYVGKIIAKDSAHYLPRLTLEMGGKNPVYIADDCNFDYTMKRLITWKSYNAGQICLNADYIICSKMMQDKIVRELPNIMKNFAFVQTNGKAVEDDRVSKIINKNHFNRMEKVLNGMDSKKLFYGGERDENNHKFETTFFKDVELDDIIMQDEIFGPLMPILPKAENIDEAINLINKIQRKNGKPLASYIFSENTSDQEKFLKNTTSGGVSVNDILMHAAIDTLPFGGVGLSGQGSFHGKATFDRFVHQKSVLKTNWLGKFLWPKLMKPVFNEQETKMMEAMLPGLPFDGWRVWDKFVGFVNFLVVVWAGYLTVDKFYLQK